VREVLRSPGRPLDADTQGFMESRFGRDFSQVRVHTGVKAAESARAVNARAYTVGEDVVFGERQFRPTARAGQRLLAHELTHVIQQAGRVGRPKRVSSPDDRTEQEAERVADEVAAADRAGSVGTDVGSAENRRRHGSSLNRRIETATGPTVQRDERTLPMPSWGTAHDDDSRINFIHWADVLEIEPDGPLPTAHLGFPSSVEEHTLRESTRAARIHFHFFAGWYRDNLIFDDHGYANAEIVVPFTISRAGGPINWHSEIVMAQTSSGTGAWLEDIGIATSTLPAGGYVTFSPSLRSENNFGIGGGAGAGPISIQTPFSSDITFRGEETSGYTINVHVPPAPGSVSLATPIHFEPDSARLEEGESDRLSSWYLGLPETLRRDVEQESPTRRIEVTGYASTTASRQHNTELSEERARVVENLLQGHAGEDANINVRYHGEATAETGDEMEARAERRVEVTISGVQPGGP
jgi:outer membrane protein OmpA-like peptidoglycan-associated protein